MEALASELRRTLRLRLEHLERYIEELRGQLGKARTGLRDALEVVSLYPERAKRFADDLWGQTPDSDQRVDTMRSLLSHQLVQTDFVEQWFAGAASPRVPLSLHRAVERECAQLGVGNREAVLTVSRTPSNFQTLVTDLAVAIFTGLGPDDVQLPERLSGRKFAIIQVPRFEGSEALWRPWILGHELTHLRLEEDGLQAHFDVGGELNIPAFAGIQVPFGGTLGPTPLMAVYRIAQAWAREFVCDAYQVHRFGPAGVAALGEWLDAVGATTIVTPTHPPGWLRLRLAVNWLGAVGAASLRAVVEPWEQHAGAADPPMPPWVNELARQFEGAADALNASVSGWPGAYDVAARAGVVDACAKDLEEGLPSNDRYPDGQGGWSDTSDEDVLNAAWLGRVRHFPTPVSALAGKSLDSLEFVRLWLDSGGEREELPTEQPPALGSGLLSIEELQRRLSSESEDRLVVRPLLAPALGAAAIDLRLGPAFIVFQRTGTPSFDPLKAKDDPRAMQAHVDKAWGEPLVLHPGELVLAASLEYMALPADLAAQVITRSSYGRLGLVTATAVQVHPHFKGCLTLELVNLGEIPLELFPGVRIAQLVIQRVDPPVEAPAGKYEYPVRPEFSKVRADPDMEVLRQVQEGGKQP